jgi:hypothetical protein
MIENHLIRVCSEFSMRYFSSTPKNYVQILWPWIRFINSHFMNGFFLLSNSPPRCWSTLAMMRRNENAGWPVNFIYICVSLTVRCDALSNDTPNTDHNCALTEWNAYAAGHWAYYCVSQNNSCPILFFGEIMDQRCHIRWLKLAFSRDVGLIGSRS